MAARYRRLTKFVFIGLNVLVAVLYLLACYAPYLDPRKWWMISLLGLGFAFLVITLVAFIFFWLVLKPRLILLSIIPLLLGWPSFRVFFAFHNPGRFDYEKPKDVLRVVHWNVGRFVEWRRNNNAGSQTRLKMMDLIKEQHADVVCIQEFFQSTDSIYYNNLRYITRELGYPYYYFSRDNDGAQQWVGQVIFSRIPLLDSGMIRFPRPSMPESLIYADLPFQGDTIRVFTTHLQSVQFKKKDFQRIEEIKNTDDGMIENSKNIFIKLKRAAQKRAVQAEAVRTLLDRSPHPAILTGDFNDVPNSFSYYTIRGKDMQDAFLESGLGVGRTYSYIAPTLRIDYVLTSKNFEVRQFNRIIRNYSDHFMLVTDLRLKH